MEQRVEHVEAGPTNILLHADGSTSSPDYEKFTDAWLQYQFVAYNKAQKEIGRSDVFGDVSFGRCGRAAATPTPTKKPATHG